MPSDLPIDNYSENLVWMDLEMTGLNPDHDKIIEIAVIVTNSQLEIIQEGPAFAIHQEASCLAKMDAWNTEHHNASGLIVRVQESKMNEVSAEAQILEFLKPYVTSRQSPLCGNSIYQDRRFLARYMPTLDAFLHYRHIDVSTIKELARRWQPEVYHGFKKVSCHRALEDIKESIAELRYYQEYFFKGDSSWIL